MGLCCTYELPEVGRERLEGDSQFFNMLVKPFNNFSPPFLVLVIFDRSGKINTAALRSFHLIPSQFRTKFFFNEVIDNRVEN